MSDGIYQTLQKTGLSCAYSHFSRLISPPYLVYIGNGQNQMRADNGQYWKENIYQVEYYFAEKDEAKEGVIEYTLSADGWLFDKSEDIYVEDEDVFLIYYYITGRNSQRSA